MQCPAAADMQRHAPAQLPRVRQLPAAGLWPTLGAAPPGLRDARKLMRPPLVPEPRWQMPLLGLVRSLAPGNRKRIAHSGT